MHYAIQQAAYEIGPAKYTGKHRARINILASAACLALTAACVIFNVTTIASL